MRTPPPIKKKIKTLTQLYAIRTRVFGPEVEYTNICYTHLHIQGFFLCRNICFLNSAIYYEEQFYTLSRLMATIFHFNPGLTNVNESANAKCWRIQFNSFAIICPLHHLTVTGSLFINRLSVKLIDENVGSVMYELALLSRIGVHYCLTLE